MTIEEALAEIRRLEALVYVPGLWRCAKCNFHLVQGNLYADTGVVTARDQPGDRCPNCDVSLWRVTEREAGNDLVRRLDGMNDSGFIAGVTWLRGEVLSLCEDTEEKASAISESGKCSEHEKGFYRGRAQEAKGIRRTIAEVVRVKIAEMTPTSDRSAA